MKEKPLLHMVPTKMMLRHVCKNLSWSDFLRGVNGKAVFNLKENGDQSGTQNIPRQMKALGVECIVTA
jgi:hypothetical protein